jgi:catechol-2,3-dioxygenase
MGLARRIADLESAERFYCEFLGFSVTQRSYPGALFLAADRYHHHVAVNTWAGPAAPPSESVGLVSYRLEVPSAEDIRHIRDSAVLYGYEIGTETREAGREVLRIRDPNGNWLELEGSRA